MIRVAIVEDIPDIRLALRTLINGSHGFECNHVYGSAEDALRDLPGREIDIVIMDIHLPEMSGIECITALRDQMPDTQFMMCTVYDDDDNIFNALSAGATGYILKKTPPVQILEAIMELSLGGAPMSSEIARRVVATFNKTAKKAANPADGLTQREREILNYLSKGYLYKEIASVLFISKETVKKHIHNIYEKLQVSTRVEALNKTHYLR